MDAEAYARQLKGLLPRGRLWNTEPDSWLSKFLLAVSDELARVDGRASDLLNEWSPDTAEETLEDWERMLGIVPPLGASVEDRRVAAAAKYIARGGQTAAYFVGLAASLGFSVAFTKVGTHRWRLDVNLALSTAPYPVRVTKFRSGASRSGDRVEKHFVPELEDKINAAKPAHTYALFAYMQEE